MAGGEQGLQKTMGREDRETACRRGTELGASLGGDQLAVKASRRESQLMLAPEQGSLEEKLCAGIGQSLPNILSVRGDSRASRALEMLDDPACHLSPSEILKEAGITFGDLAVAYRDYRITVAQIQACVAAPKIVQDLAWAAGNKVAYCERCDGFGELRERDLQGPKRSVSGCVPYARAPRKSARQGTAMPANSSFSWSVSTAEGLTRSRSISNGSTGVGSLWSRLLRSPTRPSRSTLSRASV